MLIRAPAGSFQVLVGEQEDLHLEALYLSGAHKAPRTGLHREAEDPVVGFEEILWAAFRNLSLGYNHRCWWREGS